MSNPALTRRTVSQVGQIANWKQDKATTIASLADFQKYDVADLDYLDKNNAVMASFVNFRTDAIVQTGTFVRNPAQEVHEYNPNSTNYDAVRIYYGSELATGPESDAPEVISSPLLAVDLTYTGIETSLIIPTETYGIAKVNYFTTPPVFWHEEDNIYYFETAFQHDIYDNIKTDGVPNEWGHETPIPEVETWIENTVYYYMVLDTLAEQASYDIPNEEGLNWSTGRAADGLSYTWEVTTPAWTDIDLVFNESRFWSTDKINRF